MKSSRTLEPMWWGLFSAGGVVAAFLVPAHILLIGLAVPLGWLPDGEEIYRHWLVRLYLIVLFSLPFFHCSHRIYHTLKDMGLHSLQKPLALLCYGGALAGTVAAIWVAVLL